jgi:hypothetical protein
MKTYSIYATEKVWYEIKLNAKTEEEAREMVMDGNYLSYETFDGEDFKIIEIKEEGY